MREIDIRVISETISKMVKQINYNYPGDIMDALLKARQNERAIQAQTTLDLLIKNAEIASDKQIPVCQDTGMVVVFMQVGQEVHFVGGNYEDAINDGVRQGYETGYLRKSVVDDPLFTRVNTKDNTPAVIYTKIVEGDKVVIELSTKGFGSENMSTIKMLKPAQGVGGVKEFVIETVKKAGPNACPPLVVGVGIGGTFDYAAVLAKKATLRTVNSSNPNPLFAQLEAELFNEINALNIGPQGLQGDTTLLGINIEDYPTHIAGLPCAVNISCHITRHAKEVI